MQNQLNGLTKHGHILVRLETPFAPVDEQYLCQAHGNYENEQHDGVHMLVPTMLLVHQQMFLLTLGQSANVNLGDVDSMVHV